MRQKLCSENFVDLPKPNCFPHLQLLWRSVIEFRHQRYALHLNFPEKNMDFGGRKSRGSSNKVHFTIIDTFSEARIDEKSTVIIRDKGEKNISSNKLINDVTQWMRCTVQRHTFRNYKRCISYIFSLCRSSFFYLWRKIKKIEIWFIYATVIGTVEGNERVLMKLMKRNHSVTDTTQSWSVVWGLFRGPFNQSAVVCITQFTMRCCAALIIPNCQCGLRQRAIKSPSKCVGRDA